MHTQNTAWDTEGNLVSLFAAPTLYSYRETLQAFSEEQLKTFYYNPLLDQLEGFVEHFIRVCIFLWTGHLWVLILETQFSRILNRESHVEKVMSLLPNSVCCIPEWLPNIPSMLLSTLILKYWKLITFWVTTCDYVCLLDSHLYTDYTLLFETMMNSV